MKEKGEREKWVKLMQKIEIKDRIKKQRKAVKGEGIMEDIERRGI